MGAQTKRTSLEEGFKLTGTGAVVAALIPVLARHFYLTTIIGINPRVAFHVKVGTIGGRALNKLSTSFGIQSSISLVQAPLAQHALHSLHAISTSTQSSASPPVSHSRSKFSQCRAVHTASAPVASVQRRMLWPCTIDKSDKHKVKNRMNFILIDRMRTPKGVVVRHFGVPPVLLVNGQPQRRAMVGDQCMASARELWS